MTGRQITVIGAGIGGLACAGAMAQAGANVTVLEQAAELREVGAGLQVTPNGARVIRALGLGADYDAGGLAAAAVSPTDALTGRVLARFDLGHTDPAYRFFHRATLQRLLADGAVAQGAAIRTGIRVDRLARGGRIMTDEGAREADLVIGADGIHSVARRFCEPDARPAEFTGQVAWRAVVSCSDVPPVARIWMAPGRHVVTYPLSAERMNIVAVQERTEWAEEGWHHPDDPENLRTAFADCGPDLRAILDRVEEARLWGLFRHPVARHWHNDRVAILGDAAHPTLPFLAQGANLALEDAFVLARCCAGLPLDKALPRYQALRRDRVSRAIDAANANARNYHLSGAGRRVAHLGLGLMDRLAPALFLGRFGWLYDYDPAAVTP
nr:FAD-dependent monooxygenase [Alexandriicola marinus]